jgi:hypothetical protein
MLRLHKRLPRVLLPAVLVLLAILANPAVASGRKPVGDTLLPPALRDSFPDAVSYPAVPIVARWTPAESALLRNRVGGWNRMEWMRSIGEFMFDAGYTPPDDRLMDGEHVLRAATVPELEALVPGAVLFNPARQAPGGHFIAYRDSVFAVTGLNRLFRYAGVSFDTSTMVARARLAVLLVAALEEKVPEPPHGRGISDMPPTPVCDIGSPAVPQVSFLSTKRENPVGSARVIIEYTASGKRGRRTVEFRRTYTTAVQLRGLSDYRNFDEVPFSTEELGRYKPPEGDQGK